MADGPAVWYRDTIVIGLPGGQWLLVTPGRPTPTAHVHSGLWGYETDAALVLSCTCCEQELFHIPMALAADTTFGILQLLRLLVSP